MLWVVVLGFRCVPDGPAVNDRGAPAVVAGLGALPAGPRLGLVQAFGSAGAPDCR